VRGQEETEEALAAMDWGLSVQDLEVIRFNPTTGEIRLRLDQVFLVHHGEEGECVEPFELESNLIVLLSKLTVFEREAKTTGLPVAKNHQRFLTELSVPAAVSRPLKIPGQVPLNHYW
jgi:hypothetical protein